MPGEHYFRQFGLNSFQCWLVDISHALPKGHGTLEWFFVHLAFGKYLRALMDLVWCVTPKPVYEWLKAMNTPSRRMREVARIEKLRKVAKANAR